MRAETGKAVIPLFTMGWDPAPRIERPVPWVSYKAKRYAGPAVASDLEAEAIRLRAWMRDNAASCPTGHVLVFAWNEFEEGGWICPNVGAGGNADLGRLTAFQRASWRLRGE